MKKILFRFWFKTIDGTCEVTIKVTPSKRFYGSKTPFFWTDNDGFIRVMAESYEVISNKSSENWNLFIYHNLDGETLSFRPISSDHVNVDIPQLITE